MAAAYRGVLLFMTATPTRSQLRSHLRQLRGSLSAAEQRIASNQVARHMLSHPDFLRSQNIAFYLPNDGEIDPGPLLHKAWKMGKACYLPVLKPGTVNCLWFTPFHADSKLKLNRYGIPEPERGQRRPTWSLDLVLMPLVGFDPKGNRLGMGGGFYDRSFAFLSQDRPVRRPTLIGLAHECQRVNQLPYDSWDIPLTEIITDQRRYLVN